MMTALYPATVAIDESASIDWARVMRGTSSMENSVTPRSTATASAAGSSSGRRKPIITLPLFSFSWSAAGRALTTGTTSAEASKLGHDWLRCCAPAAW